jgi:hypothetical protein
MCGLSSESKVREAYKPTRPDASTIWTPDGGAAAKAGKNAKGESKSKDKKVAQRDFRNHCLKLLPREAGDGKLAFPLPMLISSIILCLFCCKRVFVKVS